MPAYTVDGIRIREHGLKPDKHNMNVPDDAPRFVRKSSSPRRQVDKRRRVNKDNYESSAGPEELQLPVLWHQSVPASTYRSDSEMAEFDEESLGDFVSANSDYDLQTAMSEVGLRRTTVDAECRTPEVSIRE
jgi:hypothetical protein